MKKTINYITKYMTKEDEEKCFVQQEQEQATSSERTPKNMYIYRVKQTNHIENPREEEKCCQIKTFENHSLNSESNIDRSILNTLDFADRFSYNIDPGQFTPTIKWRG